MPLKLPLLRQCGEGIPLLADFFLQRIALKYNKQVNVLAPLAQGQLLGYHWPGNVREREHAVEQAVILCRSNLLQRLDLDDAEPGGPGPASGLGPSPPGARGGAATASERLSWPNASGATWRPSWPPTTAAPRTRPKQRTSTPRPFIPR